MEALVSGQSSSRRRFLIIQQSSATALATLLYSASSELEREIVGWRLEDQDRRLEPR